ncbi:MAG: DUF11 domain-containing protein [Cocleimonas sp.]|nr:DUF11 domain-containing protein [Cocleimonas sp.]
MTVQAKITPAGMIITNKAEVSWFDTKGEVYKLFSNVAEIEVAKLYGLLLLDDNSKYASAGQTIAFPHRVKNIGNVVSAYELQIKLDEDDSGDLTNLSLHIDVNGNGLVDAGEAKLPVVTCQDASTSNICYLLPELIAGEIIEFVIQGQSDVTATSGDKYAMGVSVAAIKAPEVIKHNQDSVEIIDGANITINKSVGPVCGTPIRPSDTVKFTINFTNVGNKKTKAKDFVIDGESLSGVILEDVILPNFTLSKTPVPIIAPVNTLLLVQLRNEDTNRWIKFDTWNDSNDSNVSKIGLYLPISQIETSQSGQLIYELTAGNNITSTTITSQAVFSDGEDQEFVSNTVCLTLAPAADSGSKDEAKIRFLTPTLDLKKSQQPPGFSSAGDLEDASFYRLDTGSNDYQPARDGVYIEVHSSGLNADGNKAEVHTVKVISGTGDILYVVIKETGPNTGIFRAIRPVRLSAAEKGAGKTCPVDSQTSAVYDNTADENCTLQGSPDGRIQVTVDDPGVGTLLKDAALIDPLGIVFDAAFNTPVKGADVIIKTPDGQIAIDPLTDQPYDIQTTNEEGKYQFPFLYPGYYYIDVTAPEGYTFPSKMPPEAFIDRTVNQYSYGKDGFYGTPGDGIFKLESLLVADIPLNPILNANNDLVVEKTVTSANAGIGDFASYSIHIVNHAPKNLYAVKIEDRLPYGFRYVEGSAFLDGKQVNDPMGAPGPNLTFSELPFGETLAKGELDKKSHTLTYKLRISAGAIDSDGVNTAKATGRTGTMYTIHSNNATAKVKVIQKGVLGDNGIIFGKIYVDADCSNIQSKGEWPIGGVKLYLEDGTWVVTDGNGQYSLYGIKPGSHVVKVDPISLPEGIYLKPLDNRHMADADSRLVDMKRGGYHRADFAAQCPKEEPEIVFEQIMSRNNGRTDWMLDHATKYNPEKNNVTNDLSKKTGADGDLSSGTVSFIDQSIKAKIAAGKGISRGYSLLLDRYDSAVKAKKMRAKLPKVTKYHSFIYKSGDFYTLRFGFNLQREAMKGLQQKFAKEKLKTTIVATIYERLSDAVLSRLESPQNGDGMLPPKVVVKSITKKQAKVGAWLWPKNGISLDGRFMVVIRAGMKPTLRVNGKNIPKSKIGERIENRRERAQVVAWYGVELKKGENQVEVFAKDPFGNSRTLVKGIFKRPTMAETLHFSANSDELSADGGRSYLPLTIKLLDSNGYPARGIHFVTLETTDGSWVERDIQDQTQGHQVRVTNGQRVVHLRSSERTGDITLRASDGKMKAEVKIVQTAPMRPLMAVGILEIGASKNIFDNRVNGGEDKIERHGRAAMFMKGRVKGDVHLTLSYDSDKDPDGERFRDINPNSQYPVYGDDSRRGYDAQSRSKLYAKIEKSKNSVMYGDYLTDSKTNHESVARVQRSLTGLNGIIDYGKTRVQAYVSRPGDNHIANEEMRGKGTALNYRLKHHPLIRNSEVIEVVTYSRDNPGVVINISKLSRFGDYSLDDVTGDLSFSDAIPTLDDKQNPVYIRVSYDLDGHSEKYTVAGVRLNHQVTKELNVGVSHSYDDNETKGKAITGISAEYKNQDSRITVSAATLKHQAASKDDGKAVRLAVEQKWSANSKSNLTYGRADKNYDNQGGGVAADREELRIAHRQRVSKDIGVNVEAIHSKSLSQDSVQQSVGITADVKTGPVTLKAGARHIRQKNSADSDSFNTVILGAKAPINIGKRKGSISAEYEQDIGSKDRRRVAIGADLQVHQKIKVYTKAEQINSMSGISGLSTKDQQTTFSAGIKSNLLPSTEIYSEYRLRGTIDSRDLETASGIRGDYEIEKGLSIAPRMEIVKNIEGAGKDSVSVSVGVKDVRDKNQRKSGRVELRHDDQRDYVGLEGTYVARLNEEWSVLLRDSARFDWDQDKEDLQVSNTFSVGLSSRPRRNNKHSMLFLYENKLERGFGAEDDCNKHILSTHQSYQINESISISGRLGNKYEKCSNDGLDASTNTTLADGRLIWDINKRFDADIHGGILATDGVREKQYSAGLGINYLVKQNMRIGAGYNIKGFEDDDLDSEGYNKQGVYVGMQYKFDEKNLGWLSGEKQQDRSRVEMPGESPTIPKTRDEDSDSKNSLKELFGSWF